MSYCKSAITKNTQFSFFELRRFFIRVSFSERRLIFHLSTLRSDKLRDFPERSVDKDKFSAACLGKLRINFESVSANSLIFLSNGLSEWSVGECQFSWTFGGKLWNRRTFGEKEAIEKSPGGNEGGDRLFVEHFAHFSLHILYFRKCFWNQVNNLGYFSKKWY